MSRRVHTVAVLVMVTGLGLTVLPASQASLMTSELVDVVYLAPGETILSSPMPTSSTYYLPTEYVVTSDTRVVGTSWSAPSGYLLTEYENRPVRNFFRALTGQAPVWVERGSYAVGATSFASPTSYTVVSPTSYRVVMPTVARYAPVVTQFDVPVRQSSLSAMCCEAVSSAAIERPSEPRDLQYQPSNSDRVSPVTPSAPVENEDPMPTSSRRKVIESQPKETLLPSTPLDSSLPEEPPITDRAPTAPVPPVSESPAPTARTAPADGGKLVAPGPKPSVTAPAAPPGGSVPPAPAPVGSQPTSTRSTAPPATKPEVDPSSPPAPSAEPENVAPIPNATSTPGGANPTSSGAPASSSPSSRSGSIDDLPPITNPPSSAPDSSESFKRDSLRPTLSTSTGATIQLRSLGSLLRGKVVRQVGAERQPETGAQIVLTDAQGRFSNRVLTTDKQGIYQVRLPDGDWDVELHLTDGKTLNYGRVTASAGSISGDDGKEILNLVLRR